MVERSQIFEFAEQIVSEFHPEQIILFGSHAYGEPRSSSDVDLLVVMPFEGHPADQSLKILNRARPPFSVDLLVRTPEVLQRRLAWNDFFLQDVVNKGVVLYEASYV